MRTYNRGYTGYIGSEQERAIGRVDVLLRVSGQVGYTQLCMAVGQLDTSDRRELLQTVREKIRKGQNVLSASRLEDALKHALGLSV